jgi:hypothetical protein
MDKDGKNMGEVSSLTLKEERRLRVSDKEILRRIFVSGK